MDICVYVDAPADERLIRVIQRDIVERGRDVNEVLKRYLETVKPMHEQFIEPTKKFADIILPLGGFNSVAIKVLGDIIKNKIREEEDKESKEGNS
jgi:uridine kinase